MLGMLIANGGKCLIYTSWAVISYERKNDIQDMRLVQTDAVHSSFGVIDFILVHYLSFS